MGALSYEYLYRRATLVGGDYVCSIGESDHGAVLDGADCSHQASAYVIDAAAGVWLVADKTHEIPSVYVYRKWLPG